MRDGIECTTFGPAKWGLYKSLSCGRAHQYSALDTERFSTPYPLHLCLSANESSHHNRTCRLNRMSLGHSCGCKFFLIRSKPAFLDNSFVDDPFPSHPRQHQTLPPATTAAPMEKTEPEVMSNGSEPALEGLSSQEGTPQPTGFFARANQRITTNKHLEARGIERVPETERLRMLGASNYMQMTLLWFSTNITANNMAVGMLGPLDYSLGFTDAALCASFGAILGAVGVAYISTFGPASGNRTMGWKFNILARAHIRIYAHANLRTFLQL